MLILHDLLKLFSSEETLSRVFSFPFVPCSDYILNKLILIHTINQSKYRLWFSGLWVNQLTRKDSILDIFFTNRPTLTTHCTTLPGPRHAPIQEFLSGGGGVQVRPSTKSLDIFSPQLILQFTQGVQWLYYRENYNFPRIQPFPGGSNTYRGFQLFPGGEDPNANFYRNPYNL